MPVNIVNAIRLPWKIAHNKLVAIPLKMTPKAELNLNLSSMFPQSVTKLTTFSLEQY